MNENGHVNATTSHLQKEHQRQQSQQHHVESSPLLSHNNTKPTNITILLVTTIAFALFVIAELIGAVVSDSIV